MNIINLAYRVFLIILVSDSTPDLSLLVNERSFLIPVDIRITSNSDIDWLSHWLILQILA